jgi:hypothetical protein
MALAAALDDSAVDNEVMLQSSVEQRLLACQLQSARNNDAAIQARIVAAPIRPNTAI